jgi:hypothetical protein
MGTDAPVTSPHQRMTAPVIPSGGTASPCHVVAVPRNPPETLTIETRYDPMQ